MAIQDLQKLEEDAELKYLSIEDERKEGERNLSVADASAGGRAVPMARGATRVAGDVNPRFERIEVEEVVVLPSKV